MSGGMVSFSDHHLKEAEVFSIFNEHRLFRLLRRQKKTCTIVKD
jgi:hypothetical protein